MDVLSGSVLTNDGIIEGYVCIENGTVISVEEGVSDQRPVTSGLIVPPLVNAHTHCADAGLRIPAEMSIEELVAPPDGLKHRYLRETDDAELICNMREYARVSETNGIGTFLDFREGGVRGCEALRKAAPEAVILGRPVNERYDPEEISRILEVSDGIGLPSISDMDRRYIEKVADQTRENKKIFSIHASERVREDIDFILSLDPAFIVHMAEATDSDLLKCAESDVPIAVCARSNRYFGKTPPLKRMLDCGVDIALGTDNAMICGPDMRSESSLFREVLLKQGGSEEDIWGPMLSNGRKILYSNKKIHISAGMTADLTVFPYAGPNLNGVFANRGPVFRYKSKKRE